MRSKIIGCAAGLGMLLLILDGKTAIAGAREGVELCLASVIPSLFPFFVLSILLTGSLAGMELGLLRPLGRLFRIPEGSEVLLLTGLLGGYPIGAQCVAEAYRSGRLTRGQANRMISFCSNAGPAFLFGIAAPQFPSPWFGWLLWGIQIASAWLVSALIPAGENVPAHRESGEALSVPEALNRAIRTMAAVCGWVVLFRVAIAFLSRWALWLLPQGAQTLVCGLLELTNGCCGLSGVGNVGARLMICGVLLAFGGLCVAMQTLCVISPLDGKRYLLGKCVQSGFAFLLAAVCQGFLPEAQRYPLSWAILVIPGGILGISLLFLRKTEKRGGNLTALGV